MSMAGIAKYERAAGLFRCPVCARRAQAGAAQADATMAGAAQTAAPAATPPWEETKKEDALDELTAKGQQLEHFKIK